MAKTQIDDLAIVLSASTEQLAGDLRAAVRMFDAFKKEVDSAKGDSGAAKDAAKEAEAVKKQARLAAMENKRAARESKDAWDKSTIVRLGNFGKEIGKGIASSAASIPLAGLAIGAGAIFGVHGMAEAFTELKSAVDMAAEAEQTHLAFEVMLKSGEKATQMLKDVRKFASETPFNNAELVDSSRKLIAYGLAGEQVIPTLRMLGDVSAATQTPISDLAYLYGTLAAQQRAYSRDIYQFANRGIPIYEELAKVIGKSVAEVKDLVEEGKVGFPEVVRAFKAMTEGKGRYAGLTARQADTFAGVREQLSDALQVGKIKLGKVLIEELGLKDAAKDLTHFVENLESQLDSIRPGVRFMGDLARSIAQVSYEVAKANIKGLDTWFKIDTATFPEAYKLMRELGEFLKSGKDFKLNPVSLNETIFAVHDGLMGIFIETLKGIKSIGESLRSDFIKPLGEGVDFMLRKWYQAKELTGNATPQERFRQPAAYEDDLSIVKRFRELWNEQVTSRDQTAGLAREWGTLEFQKQQQGGAETLQQNALRMRKMAEYDQSSARTKELDALRKSYLAQFDEPELTAQHKLFVQGVVPKMKGREDMALGDGGFLSLLINNMEIRRDASKAVYDDVQRVLKAELEQKQREQREAEHATTMARDAANAFAGLVGGAGLAAKELALIKAPPGVEVPWAIRAEVMDAAKMAKEQHADPVKEFLEKYNALSEGLLQGVIPMEIYDRAAADLIRKTGQKVGIGPSQLPEMALRDSAESVRILNQWQSGQMKAEDFLGQLVELAKQQLAIDQQLLDKAGVPLISPIPK